jgi:hypothetical protein
MRRANRKKVSPAERKNPRTPITKLLYRAGSSPSEVARDLEVSASLVTRVMQGHATSARVQKRIESILKKPWRELIAAGSQI